MTLLILDDASQSLASDLQRLKLAKEASTLITERKSLSDTTADVMRALKIGKRLREIGMALGLRAPAPAAAPAPTVRTEPTAEFYPDEGKRTLSQRQKDNDAAIALLRKVQAGEVQVGDAERAILAKYSGNGGGLTGADGLTGSPHEYYTPKPVASAMWDLLGELGFKGGSVLDPSAGGGIFTATRPKAAVMTQVELDETSGAINAAINDGPTVSTTVSPFEAVAAASPDEIYDAVITNVPFGDLAMRGDNASKDKRFSKSNLQEYFILRSLQKLKPGGLAAFIVPPSIVSGKGAKGEKLRRSASLMAEFLGAYRLPNKIFTESAAADTITDVIVFRKFSREAATKIEEVMAQTPELLARARVLWDEFLEGRYFLGDGKKFVLGETVRDMGKFGEVDKVVNDDSISNIAALIRRFPKSHIDWDVLNAAETAPIVYADGDVIHSNGQTLEMREGAWVALDSAVAEDKAMLDLGPKLQTPLAAVNAGVTLADAMAWFNYQNQKGRYTDVPSWLLAVEKTFRKLGANGSQDWWEAITAGMAAMQLMQDSDATEPYNYKDGYPVLSAQLAKCQGYGNKSIGGAPRLVKDALLSIRNARYKGEFTPFWLGEIRANVATVALTPTQLYEKAKYEAEDESGYVPVDRLREAFSDFDPLTADEWCIAPDGKTVTHANDYYTGTYADFLARANAELDQATDPAIRAKMVRQIDAAKARINTVDVSTMTFSLFTPHISPIQKLEFLRAYVSPDIFLTTDANGRDVFDIKQPSLSKWANEEERAAYKAMQRFVKGYLKNQNITTMSKSDEVEADPQREAALLRRIKEIADKAKAQFDAWARANEEIQVSLHNKLNAPEALRFIEEPDGTPLDIPNLNVETFRPHAYQYAACRRFARNFGGVLGFDVGLGKAQPLDAMVLTPAGFVRMGDIALGDTVIAGDGTPTTVTGVFPQGEKEIFRVTFSDGTSTECCDEHLWLTQTEKDRKNERYARAQGRPRKIEGTVKPLSEIRQTLIYQSQKNHAIPMVRPVQFADAALPVDPYLIGVLLGDGHFGEKAIQFSSADEGIAAEVSRIVEEWGVGLSVKPVQSGEGRCPTYGITRESMRVATNQLVRIAHDLGLAGTRSMDKFVPASYLHSSPEARLALLQGLMDTDGYVCKAGVTVQFGSSSAQLARDVQFIVRSLGGNASIASKTPTFTGTDGEKKNGLLHYTVHMRLPADVMPFRLQRKADRVKPKSKYQPVRYITAVESVGTKPAQCIRVDHASHLYVTDDFIVTHNTLTALASTQYAQSIGVKKKTIFVVPNATLTNWAKEAGKAYQDTSDCLFVGLVKNKKGKAKVDNAQVKVDLNAIRENRHSKIFMTLEAFKLIPLRDETMEAYVTYLTENDDAYLLAEEDAKKKRANIAADSKKSGVKDTGEKSGAIPFFEDMGVDSLVLDEAHNFKNSKMTSSQFKGAKYLADPSKSQRGMDMQAKAWYVRGLTARNDGVLSLTATPVTNSPLEVYSMLTLALGEREVNAMYGVTGADSFMSGACDVEEREEENIVGVMRPVRVFTGLQNAGLLRRLLQTSTIIKTAEDVKSDGIDIAVPEFEEIATAVDIGEDSFAKIIAYKEEYIDAVEAMKAGHASDEEKLTGSPFNLIRKMTRVINDPELDEGIIRFKFDADQGEPAAKAITAFNAKNIVEERDYDDPHAARADVKVKVVKDTETGESVSKFMVTVRARAAGNAVELLSVDYETQDVLLKLLAANGIEPTVKVSPKLAALIENFKQEAANPRHEGQAKQIIFCDELSLHHKIKLALTQLAGVPSGKIKIVNAVSVDVAGMQDVQDGYNADGEDNKYTVVIANKKAEVGINLQKGTQAIHHMTIGWTPDSIHQRNGRGVRQGNPVESVNVYHYDADGTFDAYKRKLVGIKADWIGALMGGESSKITIEGDMSKEDYELLANAVGDASAMQRINEEIAARNKRAKQAANKVAQLQSVRIIEAQMVWLGKFGADKEGDERKGFSAWVASKRSAITETSSLIRQLSARRDLSESDLMRARLGKQIQELSAKLTAQLDVLAGLPTDSKGMPAERREYAAMDEATLASGAYANYKKDLNIAQRMRQEAAVSFRNRADDGYSADALAAFEDGKAQIIAGQLVAIGSLVEYQGTLLVAAKARKTDAMVGYYPADQSEVELLRMNNATFIARGTPEWAGAVKRAVALDEATIAGNQDGFIAGDQARMSGDPRLYAAFVEDVRDGLTVAIPSAELARDSFCFKAPYFPFALDEDAKGGPLVDKIKAEQADLIASWGRYNTVRLKDLRMIGPDVTGARNQRSPAVRAYAITHRLRATAADLSAISSYLSLPRALAELGLVEQFFNELPQGVAVSKSPEELDTWALAWFAGKQDWLEIDSLEEALGFEIRRYRQTANKIDDGRERWTILPYDSRTTIQQPALAALRAAIEGGLLADEIAGEQTSVYESYMPQGFRLHGKTLAEVLFEDTGDYIKLKVGIDQARAQMMLTPTTQLYVENWGDAASIAVSFLLSQWQAMKGWAKKAKAVKAMDASGLDVEGIMAAVRRLPGILSVSLGVEDETKMPDRYSAMYSYKAGEYLRFSTVRGSDTHTKVAAAGSAGLQGRTFDNARKAFRVTLKDGEVFSDGKPVASVAALFAHLGLNMSDYTV